MTQRIAPRRAQAQEVDTEHGKRLFAQAQMASPVSLACATQNCVVVWCHTNSYLLGAAQNRRWVCPKHRIHSDDS